MTETKTLAQVVQTCDFIRNSRCKDCFGQCEFEGTEHFKGKWVLEADVLRERMELKQKVENLTPIIEDLLGKSDYGFNKRMEVRELFGEVLAVLGKETNK